VFLSTDIDFAGRFVHHHFDPLIEEAATLGAGLDWKTSLQEMAAGSALGSPEYRVSEQGPDHEKEFHARVVVGEEVLGEGHGRSKKEAEQKAAKEAWHTLDVRRRQVGALPSVETVDPLDTVAGPTGGAPGPSRA
jgi:ribonuclease-3